MKSTEEIIYQAVDTFLELGMNKQALDALWIDTTNDTHFNKMTALLDLVMKQS